MFHRSWGCIIYSLGVIVLFICPQTILPANAQEQSPQQRISLQYDNIKLADLFNIISHQTGYTFFYNNQTVNDQIKVSIHQNNTSLNNILEQLLSSRGYAWEVRSGRIGVFRKDEHVKTNEAQEAQVTQHVCKGIISAMDGTPLEGATISLSGARQLSTRTNEKGYFFFADAGNDSIMRISYTGFKTRDIRIGSSRVFNIVLEPLITDLAVVAVKSNGYQRIPPERANGSYVQINNQLLNRRVGPTLIDRLEGIASGVLFPNKNIPPNSNESYITIRGRSTILANAKPLIVVDNFPYNGDINLLNPNDVESITILKDASAASIWGAFSGNGVIVITTKKGKLNQPLKLEFNSNVTISSKPDLYYNPNFLGASEFIDVEKYLFDQGFYDADLTNDYSYPLISPVVELLNKKRNGEISAAEADAQINQYRTYDIRKDYEKYFYRNAVNQQYALNLSSGGERGSYLMSVGYDKQLNSVRENSRERFTIDNYGMFNLADRVEFTAGVSFVSDVMDGNKEIVNLNPGGIKMNYYPYAQLADANGNALALPKDYRYSFISQLHQDGLLDWTYRPLDELKEMDNVTRSYHLRFNPAIKLNIVNGLNVEIRYQFEKQLSKRNDYQSLKRYDTRNRINLFTQVRDGVVSNPIPLGGIMNAFESDLTVNNYRAQLNFNRTFGKRHNIAALAGTEQRLTVTEENINTYYGYNKEYLTYNNDLDYTTYFDAYMYLAEAGYIGTGSAVNKYNNAFISYYGNVAYTLDRKYCVTASARLDQSNLWGIETNQKGVPLWSTGLGWNLSEEAFYKWRALPYLKVRATYGYSGNLDPNLSGVLVIAYLPSPSIWRLQSARIARFPDPHLRWERTGILNTGVDFETRNKIMNGSIEYYYRKGKDLIGDQYFPMQVGPTLVRTNSANMKGGGLDLKLTSYNISQQFSWTTDFLFSYNWDKVTGYKSESTMKGLVLSGDGSTSVVSNVVGRPVYSVFGYKWAGLDPQTGDPVGYLNGKPSKEYDEILNNSYPSDIRYIGPARPAYFGALRNTFDFKNISLSVNLTYKMGYYFRRSSIAYNALFNGWIGHRDYSNRWQHPGDETLTNVPSMTYPQSDYRDGFYQSSEILVEKGDHIRLQDIKLSYTLGQGLRKSSILSDVQFYLYANNLGLVWKANKYGLDPDYSTGYPTPRSFSIGFKTDF